MPKTSESLLAEVGVGHVTVLETTELNIISPEHIQLLTALQVIMEPNSLGCLQDMDIKFCLKHSYSYPGSIESDNNLARLESVHHLRHQVQVGVCGNVGLKANVAELLFWGDVNCGIVANTQTIRGNMFLSKILFYKYRVKTCF